MSKEAIKNSTEPIKVLRLDTATEPLYETFLSFVKDLKNICSKNIFS